MGGPIRPANAASPPANPPKRDPNTKERLTMLGPGRMWQSANVSLNSSAVIQRCWSTMLRRAQPSTPPKPASDILAKARNSSIRVGWTGGLGTERSGAGPAAGGESGGMAENLERPFRGGQACLGALKPAKRGFPALFFSTFGPYIEG